MDYYRQIEAPGKFKLHFHKFPLSGKVGPAIAIFAVPMVIQPEFPKRAYKTGRSGTDVLFQRRDKFVSALNGQAVGPKPAREPYAGKPGKRFNTGGKIARLKTYVDNPLKSSRQSPRHRACGRNRTFRPEQLGKFGFRVDTPLGKHGKMGVSVNHKFAGNEI
jgi:hypothetical protein